MIVYTAPLGHHAENRTESISWAIVSTSGNTPVLPVRARKAQKIDIHGEYPCPCRRNGTLSQIALTDAFGCYRCQQIFVLREDGYLLEQLSTHYPYKRVWYWTGQQWRLDHSALSNHYLPLATMLFVVGMFVLLLAILQPPTSLGMFLRLLTVAAIALLFLVVFWLSCRR